MSIKIEIALVAFVVAVISVVGAAKYFEASKKEQALKDAAFKTEFCGNVAGFAAEAYGSMAVGVPIKKLRDIVSVGSTTEELKQLELMIIDNVYALSKPQSTEESDSMTKLVRNGVFNTCYNAKKGK